tara:strand:- start:8772 stop:8963 length:192 start_codon:yes stop_codon:yes gene_type:complete
MIVYVDKKSGKVLETVERSTYIYVDKNGKVIKVDGPEAPPKSNLKAVPAQKRKVVKKVTSTKK